MLVEEGDGKAHHGVEGTIYFGDAHIADPFLYAIGARFVEGLEIIHVIDDFLVRQFVEEYLRLVGEGVGAGVAADGNGSDDSVDIARKHMQHKDCVLAAVRLAKDETVAENKSIGSNQNLIVGKRAMEAKRLALRHPGRDVGRIAAGSGGILVEEGSRINLERNVQPREELAAARRLAAENDSFAVKIHQNIALYWAISMFQQP